MDCPTTLKNRHLQAQGWTSTPVARRICDLANNFHVMDTVINVLGEGQSRRTFAGHDQDLMKNLLLKFPVLGFRAILTHKSEISNDMMDMMRSCFSNGMGPTSFTNMFTKILHTKRHTIIDISARGVTKVTRKNNTHSITNHISAKINKYQL
ncbi:hypothetical protein BDC45DRAFT_558903 [Circinella umbellata]|nr:hypothetical protein BDC45DRAFT_558903 [Circinella umbellata]